LPTPRFDDLAEQVSATVNSRTRPWTPRATRLAAGLAAVWLAGVGGFVAVPGGPGAPNALLAAAAAAAVAVLAMQVADGGATMTAVCCLAVPAAVAALAAVLTPVSPQVISALTVVASIGLLQAAARVSVRAAGLVQRAQKAPPPTAGVDDQTTRAHDLLSGMVAGLSAAAVLGVVGAAIGVNTSGAPRFGGAALAAVSGAALLLRARWHTDRAQIAALVSGGIASLTVALLAAAATTPQHVAWLCATAVALAGTALYLGSATPVVSPVTRRGIELFEYLVLAAVVPAACWVCGCYGAARGLNLT
jgi:type VII secretion integral membrane protein EccD